ncbi:MAG: hypothetical protein GY943_28290 [Chloroflexi bacterium]|nr:hypothetical protein [Chloroflexota bacterium]
MTNLANEQDTHPIFERIEQQIARHRAQKQDVQNALPVYPDTVYPGKPIDITYDVELYQLMAEVTAHYPTFAHELNITPSILDRVPLIGHLWQSLRRQLHSISLFYTNRALTHQVQVNHSLVQAVGRLTATSQRQQRMISKLQTSLTELQDVPTEQQN